MSDTPTLWTETINELRAQLAEVQRERDEWRARHAAVAQAAASSWLSLQRTEAVLTEARAEAAAAIGALRKLAIAQRHQMAYGGGTVHVGYACKACRSDWDLGEPEHHEPACALAAPGHGKVFMTIDALRRAFKGGET